MKFFKKTFLIPFCFFNTKDYHQDAQNRRYPGQQKYKPVVFGKEDQQDKCSQGANYGTAVIHCFLQTETFACLSVCNRTGYQTVARSRSYSLSKPFNKTQVKDLHGSNHKCIKRYDQC